MPGHVAAAHAAIPVIKNYRRLKTLTRRWRTYSNRERPKTKNKKDIYKNKTNKKPLGNM